MTRRRERPRDPATAYANDVLGELYPRTPFLEEFPTVETLDLLIEEIDAPGVVNSWHFDETNAGANVYCSNNGHTERRPGLAHYGIAVRGAIRARQPDLETTVKCSAAHALRQTCLHFFKVRASITYKIPAAQSDP